MKLSYAGIANQAEWEKAGIALPKQDIPQMLKATEENPVWVHFGAGNIFRIFIAGLQQRLLDAGVTDKGIIAAETFDMEIIDRIYAPFDSLTLGVTLRGNGSTEKAVI
ncbi:MAG: mannitol dehydrogenase family protein, partial [Clostridia bacterium]|nr:mannitol dehydrogenase family protein [Clostridia bacterium]